MKFTYVVLIDGLVAFLLAAAVPGHIDDGEMGLAVTDTVLAIVLSMFAIWSLARHPRTG